MSDTCGSDGRGGKRPATAPAGWPSEPRGLSGSAAGEKVMELPRAEDLFGKSDLPEFPATVVLTGKNPVDHLVVHPALFLCQLTDTALPPEDAPGEGRLAESRKSETDQGNDRQGVVSQHAPCPEKDETRKDDYACDSIGHVLSPVECNEDVSMRFCSVVRHLSEQVDSEPEYILRGAPSFEQVVNSTMELIF